MRDIQLRSTKIPWHTFDLSVAGIGVRVCCQDAAIAEVLKTRFAGFLTEGPARLRVELTSGGPLKSRTLLETKIVFREARLTLGSPEPVGFIDYATGQAAVNLAAAHPVEDADYFLRLVYAGLCFNAGGLLFHAAGILRRGAAYLFFGHSGAGKSTVARLSGDATVLNDDLVILMPPDEEVGNWSVHATPFWNPTQVKPNHRFGPLKAMFRLVQDKRVYLEAVSRSQALAEIISNVPVISADTSRQAVLLGRGSDLLRTTPIYRLHFLPDSSFWEVVTTIDEPNRCC